MSFDTRAFKSALTTQAARLNVEHAQAWSLAQDVFAASARKKDEQEWTTIFYFDSRKVKLRDEQSRAHLMDRRIQLLMMAGFVVGRLSDSPDDHIRIAHFGDDPVPKDPINLVNYASQLFAGTDNKEINWPTEASPVHLS